MTYSEPNVHEITCDQCEDTFLCDHGIGTLKYCDANLCQECEEKNE